MNTKKFTPKTILFLIFQILIYIIMNISTITGFIMFFTNKDTTGLKFDYFDSNSYIYKTLKEGGTIADNSMNYLKLFWEKSGWPKEIFCMAFFSIIGILLSIAYTKFLSKMIIRKLDIRKENISQEKELELKRESLKIEKEKQELDILKIKAEAGLLTEKEIKRLEDRLC